MLNHVLDELGLFYALSIWWKIPRGYGPGLFELGFARLQIFALSGPMVGSQMEEL